MAITAAPVSAPRQEILELADGIELIGEFQGSGFKEPPHLARRSDGQVVQLTDLLYIVADSCDGDRDVPQIAEEVSRRYGRTVSADNVRVLAEEKLRPMGVLALADGTTPELPKRAPLLALRHRKPLLGEARVNSIASAFTWLHAPFVRALVLATLGFLDLWLFWVHGIAGAMHSAIYYPMLLVGVMASIVVATAFHEFGHASACRYGGARPGAMGVGLYLVWPAFYCDVTDAYRLDRAGRLRTDLGGVYFNAIFIVAAFGAYFLTGIEALLLVAFVQHIIIFQQLLPLLRFDGYYVLSDLTGVPDILSRIKPIFRSLVRGVKREPRVAELKPWVRRVVTVYLVVLVPALLFFVVWILLAAPRVLATIHDSLGLQIDRIGAAGGAGDITLGVFGVLALTLPVAAIALSLGRGGRMAGTGLMRWSRGSVVRRAVAVTGVAAVLGALAYSWFPNGEYEPIRPGERGTIGEAVRSIPEIAAGRPGLPPDWEREFAAMPTLREEQAVERQRERGQSPDPDADEPVLEESSGGYDGTEEDGWSQEDFGDAWYPSSPDGTSTTTTTTPAPGATTAPSDSTSTTTTDTTTTDTTTTTTPEATATPQETTTTDGTTTTPEATATPEATVTPTESTTTGDGTTTGDTTTTTGDATTTTTTTTTGETTTTTTTAPDSTATP